jgi:hypothetical protein
MVQMPELVKAPVNAVWPPADSNKRPRTVGFNFLPNGKFVTESLADIADAENVSFDVLVKLNFDVTPEKGTDSWARIINWYLKNKLNCTKLTPGGNFIFSGGETIYLPTKPAPPVQPRPLPTEKRTSYLVSTTIVHKYREPSYPDDPKPIFPILGQELRDAILRRSGHKPPPDPNTDVATIENDHRFEQVPADQVVVKRIVHRERRYLPSKTDQFGSYKETTTTRNFYAKGDWTTKVDVVTTFVQYLGDGTYDTSSTTLSQADQPETADQDY